MPDPATPAARPFDWRRFLERFGALFALILLIIATAIVEHFRVDPDSRAFLKPQNFLNIWRQGSLIGIIAIGMTFVIITGGIDLSVGSIVALTGGVAVYALNAASTRFESESLGIWTAVAICLLAGPLLGAVNGLLITKGRIAAFIATLGTMVAFRSMILAPAEGSEIRSAVRAFNVIGAGGLKNADGAVWLTYAMMAFPILAVIATLVLRCTSFGVAAYAVGDNSRAARYSGVKISIVTTAVYAISGLMCGIAGLFWASRMGSVSSSQTGLFNELDAIAAVVIGGTRLQGGSGRVFGTVIGVLILGVVSNMLNMLEVSNFYHGLVKGAIIIAAVLVQPRKATD